MKMERAIEIMDHGIDRPDGFVVRFDRVIRGFNETDYFPDVQGEETPIQTEAAAWELARKFANKTFNKCINIYVMRIVGYEYAPVPDYETRMIKNK